MKISELTQTFSVDGTEVLPIVQNSETKKVTINDVLDIVTNGTLDNLSDVTITNATNNQVLKYDSGTGQWINASSPSGVTTLADLTDVNITGVLNGQVLSYNSGTNKWIPVNAGTAQDLQQTLANGGISTGYDLEIVNASIRAYDTGVVNSISFDGTNGTLQIITGNADANIDASLLTNTRNLNLPDANGVFAMSVNGNTADSTGDINILTGSPNPTSTYIPVNDSGTFADSFLNQQSNVLKTIYGGNEIGLNLDFTNSNYYLGDFFGVGDGSYISVNNNQFVNIHASDGINLDCNSIIKTSYQGNDIGIKLDFANNLFQFSNVTCSNDINNNIFSTTIAGNNVVFGNAYTGLSMSFINNTSDFLYNDTLTNGVIFRILNDGSNSFAKITKNNDFNNGLTLDFIIQKYSLGTTDNGFYIDATNGILIGTCSSSFIYTCTNSGFSSGIVFDNGNTIIGDVNNTYNGLNFLVSSSSNFIYSVYNTIQKGLLLNYTNSNENFRFGDWDNNRYLECSQNNNSVTLYSNDTLKMLIYGSNAGFYASPGLTFIGDYVGNVNNTLFGVNDDNQTLYATNNLLVGTSGSISGQHLKINVGGTDYVIELKNP